MAKVILKEGIENISGSIGKLTFRTIHGETYVTCHEEAELPDNPTREQKAKYKRDRIVNQCVYIIQEEIEDMREAIRQRNKIRSRIVYLYDKYVKAIKAPTKLQRRIMELYRAKWCQPSKCQVNGSVESGKCLDKVLEKRREKGGRDECVPFV